MKVELPEPVGDEITIYHFSETGRFSKKDLAKFLATIKRGFDDGIEKTDFESISYLSYCLEIFQGGGWGWLGHLSAAGVLDIVNYREEFLRNYLQQLRRDYETQRKKVLRRFEPWKQARIYFNFSGARDIVTREVEAFNPNQIS